MTEIILVRHGQANSDARDEASYDRLSPLGRQQAAWLGEYLNTTNPHFDQVITGTLTRQTDTARAMGYDITRQDKRLNELQYFALAAALHADHDVPHPTTTADYLTHLPMVIDHWQRQTLRNIPQPFDGFADGISSLLNETCGSHGRVLMVTSGGVIGMVLRHILALDNAATSHVMLNIMNSSVHRLHFVHGQLMLSAFNTTPHLDTPDRTHARTFV